MDTEPFKKNKPMEESLPRAWPKICSFELVRFSRTQRVGRSYVITATLTLRLGRARYYSASTVAAIVTHLVVFSYDSLFIV